MQHVSIGLSEHVWPSACVVIVVGGERARTKSKPHKYHEITNMIRSLLQKTSERTFSKVEIVLK